MKFKAFISKPGEGINTLLAEANAFAATSDIRTVGVELLEKADLLVLSLGYVEGTNPSKLEPVAVGMIDLKPETIEAAFTEADSKATGEVICHEFFYDEDDGFTVVLLVR